MESIDFSIIKVKNGYLLQHTEKDEDGNANIVNYVAIDANALRQILSRIVTKFTKGPQVEVVD